MNKNHNPPKALGIDPVNPDRCIIHAPIDVVYMEAQRELLQWFITEDQAMTPAEKEKMENLVGFLDHFIHGVYFVAAEYHTANRSRY